MVMIINNMATKPRQTLTVLKTANENAREKARARIQVIKLIDRLQECALGDLELNAQQLRSIELLLNRTLPVVTEHKSTVETTHSYQLSNETANNIQSLINRAKEKQVIGQTIQTYVQSTSCGQQAEELETLETATPESNPSPLAIEQ
jgi:uncharacterized protein YceH (UPF0502 family)